MAAFTALSCSDSPEREAQDTLSVQGTIQPEPGDAALSFGILWTDPTGLAGVAQVSASELLTSQIHADGSYTLDFRGPPPDAAISRFAPSAGEEQVIALAWGEIVLYEDRDGDGTFRVGPLVEGSPMLSADVYRGMPPSSVVVYVPETIPPEALVRPEIAFVLSVRGYNVGVVTCEFGRERVVRVAENPDVPVELAPATSSFPNLRDCLRSHPWPE